MGIKLGVERLAVGFRLGRLFLARLVGERLGAAARIRDYAPTDSTLPTFQVVRGSGRDLRKK